jgi:hypothetical protein
MLYLSVYFFTYVQICNETFGGTVSVMLNDGMVVNNELVTAWEYVVVPSLGYCSDICKEGMRKILKNLKLG